jgi:enoyl-CoA hydratase/carnithine racemase
MMPDHQCTDPHTPACSLSSQVKAIVVTGSGSNFSAGFDIAQFQNQSGGGGERKGRLFREEGLWQSNLATRGRASEGFRGGC